MVKADRYFQLLDHVVPTSIDGLADHLPGFFGQLALAAELGQPAHGYFQFAQLGNFLAPAIEPALGADPPQRRERLAAHDAFGGAIQRLRRVALTLQRPKNGAENRGRNHPKEMAHNRHNSHDKCHEEQAENGVHGFFLPLGSGFQD